MSTQQKNLPLQALLAEQTEVFTDPTISSIIPVIYPKLRPAQALQLIEKIAACFGAIAYNMHGTRVAQKVIEQMKNAPSEQVTVLAQALALQVPQLVKDLNGNHVIQECLQRFPPGDCQFIHEVLSANVVEFGTHRHGCCVLQRCIEHGNHDQKMCLVSEIINNGLFLVQDPFGNYLLQYILEMDIDVINVKVIRQFLGHIAGLSTNKFASNVIEKCLKIAPEEVRGQIVDEICDRTKLPVLLQDQYANYVVQTSLHTCNQSQFYALQAMIRPLMQLIKNTPHGKRIESKLRTRTFEQNNPGLMSTPPRRSGYTGTGRMSDALGVTPDGQWLRGVWKFTFKHSKGSIVRVQRERFVFMSLQNLHFFPPPTPSTQTGKLRHTVAPGAGVHNAHIDDPSVHVLPPSVGMQG